MAELTGKVAIVTGASSGIGEATAKALARHGVKVILAARRKDRLDDVVSDIQKAGGESLAIEADVTDKKVCAEIVSRVEKDYGSIDILINNAGVMLIGPALEAPLEEWEKMVDLNIMGLLYMTYATLPVMRRAKSGHIINISSVAGRTTRSGSAVYNLTKWGVNAFTDSLRQELADGKTGIRTTLIEPGAVATELSDHIRPEVRDKMMSAFKDIKRLEAEDIAAGIVYAASQPQHVSVNEVLIRPTEQMG